MNRWKRYLVMLGLVCVMCFPKNALAAPEPAPEEPESLSRPEIIISNFTLANGALIAGKTITLAFEATNYGRSDASGFVMTYHTTSSTLRTSGESNRQYIGSIPAGETVRFEQQFILAGSIRDIVELGMTLDYMSQRTGIPYSSFSSVYLPIVGANSFSSKINVTDIAYAELPVFVNGTVSNLSDFTMYDVTIHIKSPYIGTQEQSLGDIEPGKQVQVSESLVYSEVGFTDAVEISFSFQDSDGNPFIMDTTAYPVTVLTLVTTDESFELPPLWMLTTLAGLLCVAVTLAVYFAKRRRNRNF